MEEMMGSNMEAPERITVARHIGTGCHDIIEYGLDMSMGYVDAVEYIRADLAAPSAPAEVEGLVKRLRQGTTRIVRHYSSCTIEDVDDADETMAEAATALTALQAEYADFEKETQAREQDFARKIGEQQARAEKAEAVAEMFAEALKGWIGHEEPSYDDDVAAFAAYAKLKGDV